MATQKDEEARRREADQLLAQAEKQREEQRAKQEAAQKNSGGGFLDNLQSFKVE